MKAATTCSFLLFLFIAHVCSGQGLKKRTVTPADYSQWHTMQEVQISEDGKWASYSLAYEGEHDTTFVKEIKGGAHFVFPQGRGTRLNRNWFSCMQDDQLQLLHLGSKKKQSIPSVSQYDFAKDGWVVLHLNENGEAVLLIKDSDGKERYRFENAKQYYLNPEGTALLLLQTSNAVTTLSMVSLSSGALELLTSLSTAALANVTWEKEGKAVAFVDLSPDAQSLYLYRTTTKKLSRLQKGNKWKDEMVLGIAQMAVLAEGGKVLFWTVKKQQMEEHQLVNIWNAQDDVLQIQRKKYPNIPRTLCIWQTDSDALEVYENKDLLAVAPDATVALRKDTSPYLPSHELDPDADYYVLDLLTGKEQLLVSAYGTPRSITLLQDGKALLYFKDANWWRYDIKSATQENLTHQLDVSFVNSQYEQRDRDYPVAAPLVADDGSAILLYDAHDIWKLDREGKNPTRLTKGKENKQVFRMEEVGLQPKKDPFWIMDTGKAYKANQPLLLSIRTEDYSAYGFGLLHHKKEFKVLRTQPKRISMIAKVKNDLVLTEESFDSPPQLLYWTHQTGKTTSIVQSNPQHQNYLWGSSASVYYTNDNGVPLQGVLFYPADYDPKKRYPMVVSIYQKRGFERHNYKNPSFFNAIGFNASNLTSKGYFVLLPDITYERNNTGYSALDCVMAAVEAALKVKTVDRDNVALIGHSFGGYETNFIITQTPFFKTAISSSGVTDLTSRYFSFSENHMVPETWRFEFQQFRMKGALFNHRTHYKSNSPIEYVENITTPLLTWTGEKDTQVNPYQAMEFYIALRRLGTPHVMLVYPDEGHGITNADKQKDLTIKMEEWLDHYLKNEVAQPWMEVNHQYHPR